MHFAGRMQRKMRKFKGKNCSNIARFIYASFALASAKLFVVHNADFCAKVCRINLQICAFLRESLLPRAGNMHCIELFKNKEKKRIHHYNYIFLKQKFNKNLQNKHSVTVENRTYSLYKEKVSRVT